MTRFVNHIEVSIDYGILANCFGLKTLKVQTAGNAPGSVLGAEIEITGLENANEFRLAILKQREIASGSGVDQDVQKKILVGIKNAVVDIRNTMLTDAIV